MNKVVLVGNLTRDPELSKTPNGISVCKFTIAVGRKFTSANGEKETDFISLVTWRGLADNCAKFLHKGSKIGVSGSLQTRSYDDKNGDKRCVTEVVCDDVKFLLSANNEPPTPQQAPQNGSKKSLSELKAQEDEGLPF